MREVCGACKVVKRIQKTCIKLGFQKLNKIPISQVRFFDYILIFQSTKMLAQIADLRHCALMSLNPFVLAPSCFCTLMSAHLCPVPFVSALLPAPFCLRPFVLALLSGFDLKYALSLLLKFCLLWKFHYSNCQIDLNAQLRH